MGENVQRDFVLPGPDYKKPSFDQEQGYQGNGIMQAAGGPGMGSEQVTTDTVRLPFSVFCFPYHKFLFSLTVSRFEPC